MGEKWGGYFKLAKRWLLFFFWYKDKGGSYHSARFIRSQFKKVRLVNCIKIFKTLIL